MKEVEQLVIHARVARVSERTRVSRAYKNSGGEITTERENLGNFIEFEHWGVSIGIGDQVAPFAAGDWVKITMEKAGN